MPTVLLTILKYFLIALIWLFFLRIARAVIVEMKTPSPRDDKNTKKTGGFYNNGASNQQKRERLKGKLKVIEPKEQRGELYEIRNELTFGRQPNCGVILEKDNFVSNMHARIFRKGKEVWLEDLGSTNGTYVNGKKITAVQIRRSDLIQIGGVVMKVTK